MPKTADFIEETKAASSLKEEAPSEKKIGRGGHPNSRKNLRPYPKGVTGNPGGKNQHDVAEEIAQAVFSGNREAIYDAMLCSLLKGNAYTFKELAERGYGKLKELKEVKHIYEEVADADLNKRIAELVRDLGLAEAVDDASRAGIAQAGKAKTNGAAKDHDLLPR